MQIASPRPLSLVCLTLALAICCGTARSQQIASSTLPDAPGTFSSSATEDSASGQSSQQDTNQQDASQSASGHQTKRILGIVPNFRAVSADSHLPPQSVREKFITATEDTFDYSAILLPAALAAEQQANNSTPEFGQGAKGYGRYFWHSYVDQSIENYSVEFIVPALTHEDTRYYTLGKGGFLKRTGYSLSRVVITRSDSGDETFNAGEVIGAGAAAGISNLYYPSRERTFGNTAQKWGTNVGVDAATFVFKEFWPDINHKLFHARD
ncbi:hypothetical protein [Granulicella sp. dw_53]|uniref:hypothetical protein n=1 Tax=Granulicella sp. dw_53 TaxID=2719792 RepID=UPI0021035EB1|nr:hypothetical protein [Granulicella sp. dw_53]